jgi:MFS family permease
MRSRHDGISRHVQGRRHRLRCKPAGSAAPAALPAAAAVVCLGLFLLGLDLTVLNVAAPDLGRDLAVSMAQSQWIIDGYALVLGGTVLTVGSLTDRTGRRRSFTISLAVCGTASAAGALSVISNLFPGPRLRRQPADRQREVPFFPRRAGLRRGSWCPW